MHFYRKVVGVVLVVGGLAACLAEGSSPPASPPSLRAAADLEASDSHYLGYYPHPHYTTSTSYWGYPYSGYGYGGYLGYGYGHGYGYPYFNYGFYPWSWGHYWD